MRDPASGHRPSGRTYGPGSGGQERSLSHPEAGLPSSSPRAQGLHRSVRGGFGEEQVSGTCACYYHSQCGYCGCTGVSLGIHSQVLPRFSGAALSRIACSNVLPTKPSPGSRADGLPPLSQSVCTGWKTLVLPSVSWVKKIPPLPLTTFAGWMGAA